MTLNLLSKVAIAQMSLDEARACLNDTRIAINDVHVQAGTEGDYLKVSAISGSVDEKLSTLHAWIEQRDHLTAHIAKVENAQLLGQINQNEYEIANGLRTSLGGAQSASDQTAHARGERFNLVHFLNENREFREFSKKPTGSISFELPINIRNLIATLDVAVPQRDPIAQMGVEMRTVADLFVPGNTTTALIEYLEETTFSNAAQETAEGSLAPLDDIGYTKRTEYVREVMDFIPIPKNTMADVAQVATEFDSRLRYSVQHRLDRQLVLGDGVGENLKGILNRQYVQTYARQSGEPIANAIVIAKGKVEGTDGAGFADATAVIMHPSDWIQVRLMQENSGLYIVGPINTALTKQIDGLPVVTTTACPLHTAVVGAFRPFGELVMREGLTVEMSTEHEDYFRRGLVALRATVRAALKITRPSAFCLVTNLG